MKTVVPALWRKGFWLQLVLAAAAAPLSGQVPLGWAYRAPLGEDMKPGPWIGAGLWSAAKGGPIAPLEESLGYGNALTGSGVEIEGGWKRGGWDLAAQVMGYRDTDGLTHASLFRGHATFRSQGGWRFSLEKEPLVWGYGLNGGYLLGEASQPVPKLLLSSPYRAISLFSVPLGSWKGSVFLGKLEGPNIVPETSQLWSYKTRIFAAGQAPVHPFLSGIRGEARFGDSVEFYMNWINLFGGTIDGRRVDEGYTLKNYVTVFLGAKDTAAEGGFDFNRPGGVPPQGTPVISASNSDVGMRIRLDALAKALSARNVWVYVSRGSKAVNISYGPFLHQPGVYLGKDLDADWKDISYLHIGKIWSRTYRYTAPSPVVPNDGFGILAEWGAWKWGLEYLDTINTRNQFGGIGVIGRDVELGHRSFTHAFYQGGFYEEGDPLGSALGGEARYTTLHAEWRPAPAWQVQGWFQSGDRPFRDVTADWLLDHPGASPVRDHFVQAQGVVSYQGAGGLRLRLGASVQRHSAVRNVQGDHGTGSRGFIEAGWRWGL
ncbi:MAG TPA: capsule assembly Wzi family protein [Holophagaceae bacterium]|nr:capsule assembly Wzi family protein [Holophagaceae bacterium]